MKVLRERRLKVAQRHMLRRMLKMGRKLDHRTEGQGPQVESSDENKEESTGKGERGGEEEENEEQEHEEEQEEEEEEKAEGETWIQWMMRTARVVGAALEKAKVPDWVEEQKRRKWRWAGHVVRRTDMRWSHRMLLWRPIRRGSRPVGRRTTRWEDSIKKFASEQGFSWRMAAKDRVWWSELEDEFATC